MTTKEIMTSSYVPYQEGSIVSKTVMDKKTGSVTIFAFDKGQGLSEHTAPFDALVHILDGDAEITVSGQHYELKKGETFVMPAKELHALRAVEKFKMLLVIIRE